MRAPRVDLDFVRRRPRWPAWVLLAVGVAIAGDALVGWRTLRDELRTLERRQAGVRRDVPAPKVVLAEATQREFDAARQVLHELALPWDTLFRTIEGAVDEHTALLAIEPDASRRALRIGGEARDYLAAIAFLQRLDASPVLADVHLLNHEVRDDVAERPVRFTLAAGWRVLP